MSATAKPRVIAIIQARMGSTRLPGKVLKPIAGEPLLWHIVQRLKRCKTIDEIAIATSTSPCDDAIAAFGREHAVIVVRGPEDDVLARFALAAEQLNPDIIVRVSSDAPFIDAGFVDHLVTALIEQDGDYVLLEEGAMSAHEGVDPFSRAGLRKLLDDPRADPVAREHVTGYFKLHPDFVKIARAPAYPALAREGARLTIDTPDDLAFVEAIHARLGAKAGEASLADLLLLLEREPELRRINSHVTQKPIERAAGLALVRCDGGGRFGFGHVKRMLSLARALRDREGVGVMFALNGTDDAEALIQGAGFEVSRVSSATDGDVLREIVSKQSPDILICDMREGANERHLRSLRKTVALLAIVDDGSDRRLAADVAYYPPVPQALRLDWTDSRCAPRIGWEWTLLGTQNISPVQQSTVPIVPVLVTMGGSDPAGLTLRVARAFASNAPNLPIRFIVGAGTKHSHDVAEQIRKLSTSFEAVEGAENLSLYFAGCQIALCAFGVTACELAANGVPGIYLCLTDDHAQSVSACERAGIGISLGLHDQLEDGEIVDTVQALLADAEQRSAIRAAGLTTIDGEGARRIAADLRQLLDNRRNRTRIAASAA
jgi:spore coat polysaccharide biosynthesis protein SpsF